MKNIQIIDGAVNCVYDIFSATEEEFNMVFKPGTDIAFNDEVFENGDEDTLIEIFRRIWTRPVPKHRANGIHGVIFYGLEEKKAYYPTRKDAEAINPDGSKLRSRQLSAD